MLKIVVASHGRFAEELVQSSYMIFGEQTHVSSLGFYPGEGLEDLRRKYHEVLHHKDEIESVILVDLFGGSPFNVAMEMANQYKQVEVCTGVNLGMLLELYTCSKETTSREAAALACTSGKEAILVYEEAEEEEDEL